VLLAFEAAEREEDPARRQAWMTFVVIGAGATGVELAGTLSEVARFTLHRDFRRIDPGQARVILVEGTGQVLPSYVPELGEKARQQLDKLGVEVRTKSLVTGVDDRGVKIGEERIEARTVLWGAGVAASPLGRSLGAPVDRAGRVLVEPDLTIPGHPDVFVIGDLAALKQENGSPVPGVAPAAMQEVRHTAENIVRTLKGKPREAFQYQDKGSLATIGRAAAVADFGKVKLSGFIAWLAWLVIHIFFLIGFRNRFLVLFQWAWSYVTYERGARLITGETPVLLEEARARWRRPCRGTGTIASAPSNASSHSRRISLASGDASVCLPSYLSAWMMFRSGPSYGPIARALEITDGTRRHRAHLLVSMLMTRHEGSGSPQ
jgi:NADH dehydrogenase